ncbi:MAG TPA: hypothetical protein VGK10_04760 [Prolixibacteraceae bacterium]
MKNRLPGFFLLVLCYFIPVQQGSSWNQGFKISSSVNQVVNKISRHNIYEYQTVGYAGKLSEQYQRFEKLERIANIDELIYISKKDKNAVVRLYAFQGLKRKGVLIPKDLQEQFDNDKSEIQSLNGCLGAISTVSQLSKEILNHSDPNTQFKNKLK